MICLLEQLDVNAVAEMGNRINREQNSSEIYNSF